MNKKRWIALILFIGLLAISLPLQVATLDEIRMFDSRDLVETRLEPGDEGVIVVLKVQGVITDSLPSDYFYDQYYRHDFFLRQLRDAYQNPDVRAVVLHINSPGGGISESDEIFHRIMQLKRENPKPLVVYMDKVATSGGYYISSPADHIVATRNTITGSIGVILQGINYHQLAENWGVSDVTVKSGPYKDLLNPFREVEESERLLLQALIDESYDYFIDAIVSGRGMDRDQVLALADGRIYTGAQALENGLVDSLGFFEDALSEAKELAGVEKPEVLLLEPDSRFNWRTFLAGRSDSGLLGQVLRDLYGNVPGQPVSVRQHPVPMYLWTW